MNGKVTTTLRMICYSKVEDPKMWDVPLPVFVCASPEDARQAEVFINKILKQNEILFKAHEVNASEDGWETGGRQLRSKQALDQCKKLGG